MNSTRALAVLIALVAMLVIQPIARADSSLGVTVFDESASNPPVFISRATASLKNSDSGLTDYWFVTQAIAQSTSNKTVMSLRVQWDLIDALGHPIASYAEDEAGSAIIPLLNPGALRILDWKQIHIYRGVAKVIVGITEVLFSDGTHWSL